LLKLQGTPSDLCKGYVEAADTCWIV